jgi:hypothetical protein
MRINSRYQIIAITYMNAKLLQWRKYNFEISILSTWPNHKDNFLFRFDEKKHNMRLLSEVLMFDLTICYVNLVTTYSHSLHQSMYPSMYLPIYLSSYQKEKSKMQMKSNNFPVRLLYMKVKKRGKSGGNELNLPKNSLYRTWLISVIKLAWVVSKNLSSLCCALY